MASASKEVKEFRAFCDTLDELHHIADGGVPTKGMKYAAMLIERTSKEYPVLNLNQRLCQLVVFLTVCCIELILRHNKAMEHISQLRCKIISMPLPDSTVAMEVRNDPEKKE